MEGGRIKGDKGVINGEERGEEDDDEDEEEE